MKKVSLLITIFLAVTFTSFNLYAQGRVPKPPKPVNPAPAPAPVIPQQPPVPIVPVVPVPDPVVPAGPAEPPPPAPVVCSPDPIDYECWCGGKKYAAKEDISDNKNLKTIIEDYVNAEKVVKLGQDKYLLCFDGLEINYGEQIEIGAISANEKGTNELILYNLNARTSDVQFVVGSNTTFMSLTLSGIAAGKIPPNPIVIAGTADAPVKNVRILNSDIAYSVTGINIDYADDFLFTDSSLTGPGMKVKGTTGILATSCSTDVKIWDNIDTIEESEIGVSGFADVKNTTFKNVATPIENDVYPVDHCWAGKKVKMVGDVTYVDKIVGLAPIKGCDDVNLAANGVVELYINEQNTVSFIYYQSCKIMRLGVDKEVKLTNGVLNCGEKEKVIKGGSCYFECDGINIAAITKGSFGYSNKGVSYGLSKSVKFVDLYDFDVQSSGAATLPLDGGSNTQSELDGVGADAGNDAESDIESTTGDLAGGGSTGGSTGGSVTGSTGGGDDPGSSDGGEKYSDGGMGFGGESSAAPKLGCTLNGNAPDVSFVQIIIMLLMIRGVTIGLFLRRVYVSRKRPR